MVDNTGYQHWHEQELDEDSRKRACDEEEDSARRVYAWPMWRNNSARSGAPDGASAGAGMDRSPAILTIRSKYRGKHGYHRVIRRWGHLLQHVSVSDLNWSHDRMSTKF